MTVDADFYLNLVRIMKTGINQSSWQHDKAWAAAVNKFTREFIEEFCFANGNIDWEKLVKFVSETKPVAKAERSR